MKYFAEEIRRLTLEIKLAQQQASNIEEFHAALQQIAVLRQRKNAVARATLEGSREMDN